MKKIILCADDYGQSAAISNGIFELAAAHRLSATSCMTESPFWLDPSNRLPMLRGEIDIGLHFNLTHPFSHQSVPAQPLNAVLRGALTATHDLDAIAKTLHTQLDRFEHVMQQAPDFIDGHQHVHIFPGIRAAILRELKRRYPAQKLYLRAVNPRWSLTADLPKTAFLKLLGLGFSAAVATHGMQTNRAFAGIYSLEPTADFATLIHRWLHDADNGDLLMCHPGHADNDISDPIRMTRPLELAFLASETFSQLLLQENVQLARFAQF